MGRRKISIQPILDDRSRSVTFSKRKSVTIFDRKRRLYVFSSHDFQRTINHVNTNHIYEHQTAAQYVSKQRQAFIPRNSYFLPSLAAVNSPNSHHLDRASSSSTYSSPSSNPTCLATSSQMRRGNEPMTPPANPYRYPYIKNESPRPAPTPTPTPTDISHAYEAQKHYSHLSPVKESPFQSGYDPTFASSLNHMDTKRSSIHINSLQSLASTQPAYVDRKAGYCSSSFSDPMKTKLPVGFPPQPSVPEYHYNNQTRQDVGPFSTSSYPYPYPHQNFQHLPTWRKDHDHSYAYNVVPTPMSMYSMDPSHALPDRLVPNAAHLPYC
ncbi:MADS-box transcription factor Pvg4 [Schizosaccharomyces octosporus yFS286]|uniref:MADS-box transcription factor Pvg4 n=1 Tax=Schizosaccharomyces octosporus (strain yFS286) TaxID=483514 RepID=S9RAC3_SCHOY|nr:MADS-box transcription factor Pvg4 [Schizosaccharomyces octosporus yFS286]EPX71074.1 MADS-box transcription factor Pvg4 [Schizosaccharomyces octosporus yFS286]